MRFLVQPRDPQTLDDVVATATAVRRYGLDGILLTASAGLPAPLVTASAVAGSVADVLIAVETPLGDRHPLELTEEAVVVDVASGGRLVLVVHPAAGEDSGHFPEGLDLLRVATAAAPFRFAGRRWRVPANLPQNVHDVPRRARITPTPARPQLSLWTSGGGMRHGLTRGLGHLASETDEPEECATIWADVVRRHPAALGAPRAHRATWTSPAYLVEQLRLGQATFNQDWAVVVAPLSAVPALGQAVRPRLQLDALPPGLEEHWQQAPPLRV